MHLAIPFTLLLGSSYVAAAPSTQHAQISVEITNTNGQNHQVDALHSSSSEEQPVMNQNHKNLPFNFTLRAHSITGIPPKSLPFGFSPEDAPDGSTKGELGITTEFAFRNGKLINGDRALGYNVVKINPPWTSLWSLNGQGHDGSFIELITVAQGYEGTITHFLVFEGNEHVFGAHKIRRGEPIYVARPDFPGNRLLLVVEPIGKSSDNINADSAEELL